MIEFFLKHIPAKATAQQKGVVSVSGLDKSLMAKVCPILLRNPRPGWLVNREASHAVADIASEGK